MISQNDLRTMAEAKLQDAEVLHANSRFEGAVYLSGYVIELALKAKICRTLQWTEFPETGSEFQHLQSFKVHNLDILLRLSGVEKNIKARYAAHWQIVSAWSPEIRYKPVGTATMIEASEMITSTNILLGALQ